MGKRSNPIFAQVTISFGRGKTTVMVVVSDGSDAAVVSSTIKTIGRIRLQKHRRFSVDDGCFNVGALARGGDHDEGHGKELCVFKLSLLQSCQSSIEFEVCHGCCHAFETARQGRAPSQLHQFINRVGGICIAVLEQACQTL